MLGEVHGWENQVSIEDFERRLAEANRDIGMARVAGAADRAINGWMTLAVAGIREYATLHQHFPSACPA